MYPEIRTNANNEVIITYEAFRSLPTENIVKTLSDIKQDKRRKNAAKKKTI